MYNSLLLVSKIDKHPGKINQAFQASGISIGLLALFHLVYGVKYIFRSCTLNRRASAVSSISSTSVALL
jgi:hypothetical protein